MATYTVDNTFTADTTAIASEVNQNFTNVLDALNSFDAANLTGTINLARISDLTSTQMASTFFLDEDNMASNSATAVSSQQAIKTHVAASSTDGWDPTSYAAEESITFANGLILKQGQDTCGSVASVTVTFAVAFPTAAVSVWIQDFQTSSLATSGPMTCHTLTTTTVRVRNGNAGSRVFKWFALGY